MLHLRNFVSSETIYDQILAGEQILFSLILVSLSVRYGLIVRTEQQLQRKAPCDGSECVATNAKISKHPDCSANLRKIACASAPNAEQFRSGTQDAATQPHLSQTYGLQSSGIRGGLATADHHCYLRLGLAKSLPRPYTDWHHDGLQLFQRPSRCYHRQVS